MDKIEVINLVPKFLAFFNKAKHPDFGQSERFQLWEEHYNFAAVPPGDEGKEMARKLVENAWDQYEAIIPYLQSWQPNEREVLYSLQKVKQALGYKGSLDFAVLYFVGAFDSNPFVAPYGEDRVVLCLPVEEKNTEIVLAHEITHIVHSKIANLTLDWERTIGSTILQEGLAIRVSQHIVAGESDEAYVEHKPGWLGSAHEKESEMIQGVIPYLAESSSDVVVKFTFGAGTTGLERESYYLGWLLVGELLKKGHTFEGLANLPEKDLPEFVSVHLKMLHGNS